MIQNLLQDNCIILIPFQDILRLPGSIALDNNKQCNSIKVLIM